MPVFIPSFSLRFYGIVIYKLLTFLHPSVLNSFHIFIGMLQDILSATFSSTK